MNNLPTTTTQSNDPAAASSQKEDYLDKAVDSAEKKYGGEWGQDTQKNRGLNEKITDGARNLIEKTTGKDVPDKISN